MFKGYQLEIDSFKEQFLENSDEYDKELQNQVSQILKEQVLNHAEYLDASEIEQEWFPGIEADVFISHSHKDICVVEKFAAMLQKDFGLKVFIDAMSWKYADDLLRIIDGKYCKIPKSVNYSYEKRNISTAHIHNILSVALFKMIYKTECVIFLKTPNSINTKDEIVNLYEEENQETTSSPWIYNELNITKMIREITPERLKRKTLEKREVLLEAATEEQKLRIDYPVGTEHLINLTLKDILEWATKVGEQGSKGKYALDELYKIK